MTTERRIVVTGGAGLVGQNLVARLSAAGWSNLVVLDKHAGNLRVLRELHPGVECVDADLAEPGDWPQHFDSADVVIMLHAQIGGNDPDAFTRNNVEATRLVLAAARTHAVPHIVHVSSSAVNSVVDDLYANSKRAQEAMVRDSGLSCVTLRPTLMFGWFDRKHLGWLARFMSRSPVFPVPGRGRYRRQPLFVANFCDIIVACLERDIRSGAYDISGVEEIDYIDIIRTLKHVTRARARIVQIPYLLFYALLWIWGRFERQPPFTTQQLAALVAPDEFPVIDWPDIFGVEPTPFRDALVQTFGPSRFSHVVLERER
ncbi:NAD-dependent epimerase/dehydratase family protein [Smaragdicoccus niigatensis]|uniref:NAD-dependent epimerase/dehydratase family protein n=1 Tax=Smaragdicoccus niigatensis TaxID=359359 RepID=UPI000376E3E8|nr:NAD(P)-dependent oxidoreductase [Smaragdicoccus niigatensis]